MNSANDGTETARFSLLQESDRTGKGRFYDSSFISEYGRLEAVRSERYGIPFSIVVLHVESFHGGKVPDKKTLIAFLKTLVRSVHKVIRSCDITGILGDKSIIILLPHTDYFGSLITIKKLSRALEFLTKEEPHASLFLSQATFPKDASGFGELVSTATARISERIQSQWEKLELRSKLFWETVAVLTGTNLDQSDLSTFDVGPDHDLGNSFLQRINETVLQEIRRKPEKKGILYIGAKKISKDLPIVDSLNSLGRTSTKIFLVGEGRQAGCDVKNATAIYLADHRLLTTYFTLFLSEDMAYGLICRESWGDAHNCFHTSDPYVVESLITKFQRDYTLQEQL